MSDAPAPGTISDEKHDLDGKIVRGSSWIALSYGGRSVLSMLAMLVLARLLTPQAFGTVALASVFLLVLEHIQNSGVAAAVIYRRHGVEEAAASAFVFSTVVAVPLTAAAAAAAPLAAWALHAPSLTNVMRAMSLLLLVRGLGAVPNVLLERSLDYRSKAKSELSAGIVQIGVSIGLAAAGMGVWSLVLGQIAAAATEAGLAWLLVPWRPSPRLARWATLRELMRYGRFVTMGNLVGLFNETVDGMAVARLLSTSALGYYTIAFRIASFPCTVIGYIVNRVMFPAYAVLQDDLPGFRNAFVQTLQRIALLSLPVGVILVVAARPIVLTLLGASWLVIVTPLKLLGCFSLVRVFTSPTGGVFQAAGKPQYVPLLALPHAVLLIPALVLFTPRYGVSGAALAILVSYSASGVAALFFGMRVLELKARELLAALGPVVICSAALLAALLGLLPVVDGLPAAAALAVLLAVGVGVYVAAAAMLARGVISPVVASFRRKSSPPLVAGKATAEA